MTKKELQNFLKSVIVLREGATDEIAIAAAAAYPAWKENISYTAGERVLYNEILYKVLQNHTSQSTWTPIDAPSLFAKVLIPNDNIIPEWEQPDSTNPYLKDDKVIYNDQTWISVIDNNVWAPGAYGWEIV